MVVSSVSVDLFQEIYPPIYVQYTTYFHKKSFCYVLLPIATTLVFFFILSLKRDAKVTLKLPLHWVYQVVGLLWKPNKPTCIIFFNILIFTTTRHWVRWKQFSNQKKVPGLYALLRINSTFVGFFYTFPWIFSPFLNIRWKLAIFS